MHRRGVGAAGFCCLALVLLLPPAASAASAGGNAAGRGLQQLPTPPKFFISGVNPSLTNTYSWSVNRVGSASGVVVQADGSSRQQIGYTLTFNKQLESAVYKVEGQVDITNASPVSPLTLKSLTLVIAGSSFSPPCRSIPTAPLVLAPAQVVSCPFSITLPANTGLVNNGGAISGYIDTSVGRRALDAPVPFSFAACLPARIPTERTAAVVPAPAPAGVGGGSTGTGGCTVRDIGGCVTVTDGSYIFLKYKDVKGTAAAGNVTLQRSQLFGVAEVSNSVQGPPRVEPVQPPSMPAGNGDQPSRGNLPQMPDSSWYLNGHRRLLLNSLANTDDGDSSSSSSSSSGSVDRNVLSKRRQPDRQQQQQQSAAAAAAGGDATAALGSRRRGWPSRHLQQQQLSLGAAGSKSLVWPYPQVTGVRPPLGLAGVPSRPTDKPESICATKSYPFSMIFGPLMPDACGTYEVQNNAGAAYVDGSRPPVTTTSVIYLQVICPAGKSP